jgi:hypothetical protein
VHSKAFAYLSEYGQSDCGFPHLGMFKYIYESAMWEHCTFNYEIFKCGKVYYSNSIIIIYFVNTLYPQKLATTSPTSGGRSVDIVRSRTKATELVSKLSFPSVCIKASFLPTLALKSPKVFREFIEHTLHFL